MGFTFNNQRKNYLMVLKGRQRPAWAPLTRNLLTAPNHPGAYLKSTQVGVRELTIPIAIEGKDIEDIQKLKEDLADWLVTDTAKELVFDDEPDRSYFAIVDDTFDPEEIVKVGTGELKFICLDPYKYGKTKVQGSNSGTLEVRNEGNIKSLPTFEIQVDNDYTNIDVSNGTEINRIGRQVNIEDYAAKREEVALNDSLSTLTGWAKTEGKVHIDGLAAGNMRSDGSRFLPLDFGTMNDTWHGPFYKKSLGQTLTDFRMEAIVELVNTGEDKFGKVEWYLLDENNLPVCMLTIKDVDSTGKRIYATLRTGGGDQGFKDLISTHGDQEHTFWNFYGMLRIERTRNRWTAYVTVINRDTGKHVARSFVEYYDTEQQFMRNPSQVGIYMAQYGERKVSSLRAYDVKVWKLNLLTENQIPYIVKAGDIVTFDNKNQVILINGEPRMDLKAFSGEFFGLNRGINSITTSPPLPTKATWREGYK
ncbi:distal tail protein Dit [Priestia megaterium]|uniref:distal tail protein Dit n=1 Tax=Priestia megaterium TaxID=1404 RepID=UPI003D98674D